MAQQTRTIRGPRTKCEDFYKPVDCLDFQHELLILDGSHDSEMLPILFFVLLSFSPIHFYHLMVLARYLLLIDRYLDSLIDPLTRPFASEVLISDVGFYRFQPSKWWLCFRTLSFLKVTLLISVGAADGTGTSAICDERGSGCSNFDNSSFNSIFIMSSWIFSAS